MADREGYRPEGDEEEEDELDETAYKSSKDAVIFAIEVSESMLAPSPPPPPDSKQAEQDSPVSAALECAYRLMQQRIISNPNDLMAVVLFGIQKEKSRSSDNKAKIYDHCYLLTDLDVPAAEDVKTLRSLVENPAVFHNSGLAPEEAPDTLCNLLWYANNLFTDKAPNFGSRRLFIVTNDDSPGDRSAQRRASTRAKDLYDLGIVIELFPISKPGQEFDRSKFYDEITFNPNPTDPSAPSLLSTPVAPTPQDGLTLLSSLLSAIASKAVAKRALFSNLPLEIAPGLTISIKGYILYKRQEPKRTSYIWQRSEGAKAQIAVGKTTQMADDTSRTVEKAEIRKAFKFGGEQILFTPEEAAALRHFGEPGIRIVGFKPRSMLPFWANLRPATFIYPSEEDYVGSTRVFSALWQKLLHDQTMALAWYVARKNAAPVVAALIAGAERLGDDGVQAVVPGGLWIVPLPYADDIRQDPDATPVRASDALVDRMRVVVQQLQLPKAVYHPDRYPNPALQWHYRILQALALDEDIPTQPDDKTKPAYRQIAKRAGEHVVAWGNELEKESDAYFRAAPPQPTVATTLAKRPAKASPEPASKRAKVGDGGGGGGDVGVGGEVDDVVRKAFDRNEVGRLTVAVLKEFGVAKGLIVGGAKKAELVERVEEWFESKR